VFCFVFEGVVFKRFPIHCSFCVCIIGSCVDNDLYRSVIKNVGGSHDYDK
jgi:hypothetical protein